MKKELAVAGLAITGLAAWATIGAIKTAKDKESTEEILREISEEEMEIYKKMISTETDEQRKIALEILTAKDEDVVEIVLDKYEMTNEEIDEICEIIRKIRIEVI